MSTVATPALNAPVRSLEMLDLQIAAGATEIYLGLAAAPLTILTFNALAVTRDDQPTQVSSPSLLADLVSEAHARALKVHFSANIQYLPPELHDAYVEHVREAVALEVDTVIVANIGLLRLLRSAGITIPLVAAGYLGVSTTRFARYLRDEFGVARIVMPHAMTLEEIAAFCRLPGLEIEVPIQTGAGMSCGRCMMHDSAAQPEFGLGCRAGYTVRTPDGATLAAQRFLDGATDCALCNLDDLLATGVHALRVPGRESPNLRTNAKITQIYRKAIDEIARGKTVAAIKREIDDVELLWQMMWVPRFCENQRCRFGDTPTTRSYI